MSAHKQLPSADSVSSNVADAAIARLSATPWAAALIKDAKWTVTGTPSRVLKATGEDALFAETLSTDRTIRTFLTLRPTEAASDEWAFEEIVTLVEIGEGLNVYAHIIHGGIAATLLDEVSGVLLQLNMAARTERMRRLQPSSSHVYSSYFTAYMNTSYRKPVPTPSVILCRARLERIDGRKVFIHATIEDGKGTILTVGESMFLEIRNKL